MVSGSVAGFSNSSTKIDENNHCDRIHSFPNAHYRFDDDYEGEVDWLYGV